MDGRKSYRFTVHWGIETDTDDAEGRSVVTSENRPTAQAIRDILPCFIGTVMQTPPRYSALKIDGERAYDLARDGEVVELAERPIQIDRLDLISIIDSDHAEFTAHCGKGTYVRALARDMGRALGSCGHVSALRRTAVGPFAEKDAVPLDTLQAAAVSDGALRLATSLLPVEAGVTSLPALTVSRADAGRLARGQGVLLRGRDAPVLNEWVAVFVQGALIALAEVEQGEIKPRRVFNLGGPAQALPASAP
jgi:tRNA pseudouridine55 synthase